MIQIASILPASKTMDLKGVFTNPDDAWEAAQTQLGKPDQNRKRWHLGDPIIEGQNPGCYTTIGDQPLASTSSASRCSARRLRRDRGR